MTSENNPFELGLDRLVDLDVDCIARDALPRIKKGGREPQDRRGWRWTATVSPH